MTKREAKRRACSVAATLIERFVHLDDPLTGLSDEEDAQVTQALRELRIEFDRRSQPTQKV